MSFQVDPSFKKSGNRAKKRAAQRKVRRVLMGVSGGLAVLGIVAVAWVFLSRPSPVDVGIDPVMIAAEDGSTVPVGEDGFALVQMEETGTPAVIAARAPFIDLAKDPMILHLDQAAQEGNATLEGPTALPVARIGMPSPTRLSLIRDDLVIQETRLVTTIPSSSEDLAFFQAARSQGLALIEEPAVSAVPVLETQASGDLVSVDGDEGSWGELIETESGGSDDTATYVETRIQNTTSVALTLRESERRPLYSDDIVVLQTDRDLGEILQGSGLDETAASLVVSAAKRLLNQDETLGAGSVVAMRLRPEITGLQLMQMSIYSGEGYVGTLAQIGAGRFDTGADPWIGEDLLQRTDDVRPTTNQEEVRLLDAIYSAAIRNGLSTTMVGELIVMMSQSHDLDRFAAIEDKFTVLYATEPGPDGQGAGQILYAGIRGPSGELDCYVVLDPQDDSYSCFSQNGAGGSGNGGIGSGMIVPVNGTKTSGFGPRMHPILRQLRNHNGVDWAAPTGTPILAVADGTIALAGNGGGYGNVVYIDHSGGRQSRYAHMNRFADGIRTGAQVRQGDVIGYVGTTGRSTGPHLHFELRVNGNPVDPLTYQAPAGAGTVVTASRPSAPASGAVEALVNQIIAVESAGNANAANPRSTAVGLGQFIQSTWLRMMETYRPDLASTMSRADLLALRTNPELSREMVTNLARENEAFLRARGHTITPGRLYLAHFLGPGGAHTALSANPNRLVSDVMGESVVRANPFLRGDTIGELWAWADRKMGRAPTNIVVTNAPPPPAVIPREVREYMEMIEPLVTEET